MPFKRPLEHGRTRILKRDGHWDRTPSTWLYTFPLFSSLHFFCVRTISCFFIPLLVNKLRLLGKIQSMMICNTQCNAPFLHASITLNCLWTYVIDMYVWCVYVHCTTNTLILCVEIYIFPFYLRPYRRASLRGNGKNRSGLWWLWCFVVIQNRNRVADYLMTLWLLLYRLCLMFL